MTDTSLMAQPLLSPLRALTAAYEAAGETAAVLIAALVGGDFAGVRRAVAAQTGAVDVIARAEERWAHARDELAATLREQGFALAEGDELTVGALLQVFPPDDAEVLRNVRHELLTALLRLQVLNRQAGVLLRNAQGVIKRTVQASAGDLGGYGPTGAPTLPGGGRKAKGEAHAAKPAFALRPSPSASLERRA